MREKTKMKLIKSLTVAGLGGIATMTMYPKGTINLFSKTLPLYAGISGVLVLGSLFSDFIHDYVFPHLHWSEKTSEPVSAVLAGASNTVGVTGMLYLYDPTIVNGLGMGNIAILGLGSEVAGTYVYEKCIKSMVE